MSPVIPGEPRGPGRREEDLELRKLLRNRWAKRLATVLLGLLGFWAGSTREEWARIPSSTWTDNVNGALKTVEVSRVQLVELSVRVDGLRGAVEANGVADQRARDEMLGEIRILRADLHRWFRDAGVAAAPIIGPSKPQPRGPTP